MPQLAAVFFGLFGSLMSTAYWRERARQHRRGLGLLALILVGLVWLGRDSRQAVVATPQPSPTSPNGPTWSLNGNEWLAFRGSLDGGGPGCLDPSPFPSSLPNTIWSHREENGGIYLSSPVAAQPGVFVGVALVTQTLATGSIDCYQADSGQLRWRCLTRHPVFSSPVLKQGRVYCGEGLHENEDCKLYCLDANSGKTLWTRATHGHIEASPTLWQDRIYFSAGGDGLYCLEASTGKSLWHNLCGHTDSSAAVGSGRVYVGTAYGDDAAICLNAENGKTLWKKPQNLPVWGHAALAGERVYFGLGNGTFGGGAASPAGAVIALDSQTGKQVWRHNLPDSVNTSLCLDQQDIICGCRDGFLYCLSVKDGSLSWKADCGRPVLASPVLQGQTIWVAGGDGRLHSLNRADGKKNWAYLVADVPCESSPILAGGRMFLGCGKNLLCLGP